MNTPWLKGTLCTLAALAAATIAFAAAPTPREALEDAKSVVLVQRVLKEDNKIHSYVKEVWRIDPDAAALPPVGSEYRDPIPYNSRNQYPERDGIVFAFGKDRPTGLPIVWIIPVVETGLVHPFEMDVENVRRAVMKTPPKA